jgi:hypothetical protein
VTRQILPVVFVVELLNQNVELMPSFEVVDFFEGVQLTIIGPAVSVDFGLGVLFEAASHLPLAVYKATISKQQLGLFFF